MASLAVGLGNMMYGCSQIALTITCRLESIEKVRRYRLNGILFVGDFFFGGVGGWGGGSIKMTV